MTSLFIGPLPNRRRRPTLLQPRRRYATVAPNRAPRDNAPTTRRPQRAAAREARWPSLRSRPGYDVGMIAVPVLDTERLTLTGHRVEDLDDCVALWSDPQVTRHIGGKPSSRE